MRYLELRWQRHTFFRRLVDKNAIHEGRIPISLVGYCACPVDYFLQDEHVTWLILSPVY